MVDVAGDMCAGASGAYLMVLLIAIQLPCNCKFELEVDVLKAAGTPTMTPLPVNSLAMLTLLPGESSTRSTLGMASPTLTKAGRVAWKRADWVPRVRGTVAVKRRAANILQLCMLKVNWEVDGGCWVLLCCVELMRVRSSGRMRWSFLHLRSRISSFLLHVADSALTLFTAFIT